ncbi:MAG: GAF domain-containing protein, partial [Chloroflexi bacterium]|nr:GAF domain-containing protein [Chloroflexota bacterium]
MTFDPSRSRPLEHALAEAALGRVLQALVQMPGVAQVAEATLNACRTVTGAAEVYLLVRQGDRLRLQAAIGLPPPEAPVDLAWDEGLEGAALRLGQTIHCLHPEQDPRYSAMPGRQAAPGVLAVLPLRLRGEATGVLACARSAPVPFSDVELRWLRHFADMLAVAAENGRLLAGERRNRAQEEILGRVAAVPGGEVREFCQRMAEALAEALGMHHAGILLHDPSRGDLVILGWAPAESAGPRRSRLALPDGGALAEALRRNEVWVLQGGSTVRELADACGVEEPSSALLAPLPGAVGPRGLLLLLGDDALSVEEQDAAFLRLVAERVALTLNRAEVELDRARSLARQEFLAVVSHELRTPLAVIKAYTEVLAR